MGLFFSWIFFAGFTANPFFLLRSIGLFGRIDLACCRWLFFGFVLDMSGKPRRPKCLCCRKAFTPDHRNRQRQRYCSDPCCRRASHRASQRRWRRKPENRDHFRGPDEVRRVQEWRRKHPGYWKQRSGHRMDSQSVDDQRVDPPQTSRNAPGSPPPPLQDVWWLKSPAFVGLISMVTGSTLQDDIEATLRQMLCRGRDILGLVVPESTNLTSGHDRQTSDSTGPTAPGPQRL
jgi:hypothetical protein